MEVRFYRFNDSTQKIELRAVVDDYSSFVFTRSYSGIGSWQMVLPLVSANAARVLDSDVISFRQFQAGLITKITRSVSSDKETLTIQGLELKGLLKNRITVPPAGQTHVYYRAYPHRILHSLLISQFTEAAAERKIPGTAGYTSSLDQTDTTTLTYQGRYSSLEEDVRTLCEEYGLGLNAYLDYENRIFWDIYEGVDRTKDQSANPRLILSYDNDTLYSSDLENKLMTTNYLVVAGQGEGVDRAIATIGTATGFRRVEGFVDARDVEDASLLPARGAAKLAEYGDSVLFSARASVYLRDRYQTDFDLGDLCTILESYGDIRFEINARITEITECYENGDMTLDLTFGYDRSGLADVIGRLRNETKALLNKE